MVTWEYLKSRVHINVDMLIWLSQSSLLVWFCEVSLIRDNQGKVTDYQSDLKFFWGILVTTLIHPNTQGPVAVSTTQNRPPESLSDTVRVKKNSSTPITPDTTTNKVGHDKNIEGF